MKLSTQIKPVSYLKAHAAEIIKQLSDQDDVMIITRNGEARAVIQGIDSYEKTQETMALLKILALGDAQIKSGKVQSATDVIKKIRESKGQ